MADKRVNLLPSDEAEGKKEPQYEKPGLLRGCRGAYLCSHRDLFMTDCLGGGVKMWPRQQRATQRADVQAAPRWFVR